MVPKFRAFSIEAKTMHNILAIDFSRNMYCLQIGKATIGEWFWFREIELMQSTGLKDKNGVEIFVGDIVILTSKSINYADTYWHNYAEVFQQPNGAYRLRGKGIYETELYGNRKQVTLTGNIYETPELLENDRFCTETDDPDY